MTTVVFDSARVAKMMDDAMEFCAKQSRLDGKEQALAALQGGDCCVCEYVRYALAKELAGFLGSVDQTVKAVYTYEPEFAAGAEVAIPAEALSRGINLVALVSRKSAALSSVVAAIDASLAEQRKALGCPQANGRCMDLDVKFVDDLEVQQRRGYGALIGSLHVNPVELWRQ
jgi:hypothetical protein